MKSKCPHCNTVFRVSDGNVGKRAKCSKCGEPFSLSPLAETLQESPKQNRSTTTQDPAGYLTCSECGEVDILPGMGDICPSCGHLLVHSEEETVGNSPLATVKGESMNRPTDETFRIQTFVVVRTFLVGMASLVTPLVLLCIFAAEEGSMADVFQGLEVVFLLLFLSMPVGVYYLVCFVKLSRTRITLSDKAISIKGTSINWDDILEVERKIFIPFLRDERIILVHKNGTRLPILAGDMDSTEGQPPIFLLRSIRLIYFNQPSSSISTLRPRRLHPTRQPNQFYTTLLPCQTINIARPPLAHFSSL